MKHSAPETTTFTGDLNEDLVTATDGKSEVVEMPRALFDSTYSRFGWTLLDTTQPDPQWPTTDPDQPAWPDTDPDDDRGPFDAYLPADLIAEESA